MNSRRTLFIILILTAGLALVAGCVGQVGEGKNIGNVASTVFVTSIPIPVQIEFPKVLQEGLLLDQDRSGRR